MQKRLQQIRKGCCPNFFIAGKSISSLEKLGIQVIEKLEAQQVLDFRGVCRHFTIMMPYYDTKADADRFMKHLRESISIARDGYDKYQGFILLEFAPEWAEKGKNHFLDQFFDFVQKNENLRFVLLMPLTDERADADAFFEGFFRCGCCIRIEHELESVHENVAFFCDIASDKGYAVTEDAKQYLYQRVKERDELAVNNTEVMIRLADQISFDRELEQSKDRKIEVADIRKYLPEHKSTAAKHPIGFIRV